MKRKPANRRLPARQIAIASALAAACMSGQTYGQQNIGVSFVGRGNDQLIGIDDLAGLVPQRDWNNLGAPFDFPNNGGGPNTSGTLTFDNGVLGTSGTSAVTISMSANDSWNSDTDASIDANHKLMKGIVKAAQVGGAPGFTVGMDINNLTIGSNYRLVAYTQMNGGGGRGDFGATGLYNFGTYFATSSAVFDGTFTQATAISPSQRTANADYIDWGVVTPDATGKLHFTMRYDGGADGVGLAGFQLIQLTSSTRTWTGATNLNWNTTSANWTGTGGLFVNDDIAVFDNTGVSGTINVASGITAGGILVDNDGAHAYTLTGNSIGGAGGLTKRGVGTLTLGGTNAFTGNVTIEAGTLSAGTATALGGGSLLTLGSASTAGTFLYTSAADESSALSLSVAAGGGTVNVQNAVALTFNGDIFGPGNLTKAGPGTLAIGGSTSQLTGQIAINAGSVRLAGAQSGVVQLNAAGASVEYTNSNLTSTPGSIATSAGGGTVNVSNATGQVVFTTGSTMGGVLTKAGPGSLSLTGAINFGANTPVLTGGTLGLTGTNTLSGNISIPANSRLEVLTGGLDAATVTLNGGTLAIPSVGSPVGGDYGSGLYAQYYGQNPASVNGQNPDFVSLDAFNSHLNSLTPALANLTSTNARTNLDFNNGNGGNGAPFADQGFNNADNIEARFRGFINLATADTYTFSTRTDDGSILFIDGQQIAFNNFFQGETQRGGSINLSAGQHTILIGFYEGGGGAGLEVKYSSPSIAEQIIPNSILSPVGKYVGTNAITVSNSSTIDLGLSNSSFGALTLASAGKTLTITPGTLTVTGTTFSGPGAYTINQGAGDFFLGPITDGGADIDLVKSGNGTLILNNATATQFANPGSTITISGGQVGILLGGANNPTGNATISFAGGGLALSSASGAQSYPLPPSFGGNGSFIARQLPGGVAGQTITLTGNLPVGSNQVVTLGTRDNYTLVMGGSATGTGVTDKSGRVVLDGGTLNLTTNTAVQGLNVELSPTGGAATLNFGSAAPTVATLHTGAVGSATINVGVGTGASTLTINGPGTGYYSGVLKPAGTGSLGIVMSGTGKQTLANSGNSISDGIIINSGTFEIGDQGAQGTGPITLAGGTLQLSRPGLTLKTYDSDPGASGAYATSDLRTLSGVLAHYAGLSGLNLTTTTASNGVLGLSYNPDGDGDAPFAVHGNTDADTIEAIMTGKFVVTAPGNYKFSPRSDDGSIVFVDGNLLTYDNFPQGITDPNQAGRDGTISLTAGLHDIVVVFNEGGGGAGFFVNITDPSSTTRLLTNFLGAAPQLITTDFTGANAVNLTASSTIDLRGGVSALGALTHTSGMTLTTTAGTISFSTATLSPSGTFTYNIASGGTISISQIAGDGASAVTITKTGAGTLLLGAPTTAQLQNVAAHVDVTAGGLAAVGTTTPSATTGLGNAVVNLANGTTLTLGSTTGGSTFANTINLAASATVGAGNVGSNAVNNETVTVSKPITVTTGNSLTVQTTNGYTLNTDAISGGGNLTLARGTVNLNAPANVGAAVVSSAPLVGGATIGGTLNAADNFTATSLTVNAASVFRQNATTTISGGATVAAYGEYQSAGGTTNSAVTLNGGTFRAQGGVTNLGTNAITAPAQTFTANALDGHLLITGVEGTGASFLDPRSDAKIAQIKARLPENVSTINFPIDVSGGTADDQFGAAFGLAAGALPGRVFTAAAFGRYTPSETGVHLFNVANIDDNGAIWIDLNQNGIFETAGSAGNELIVQQGCCGGPATPSSVTLRAGQTYNIAIAVEDTGGGSGLTALFSQPSGTLAAINPGAAGQAGLWSFGATNTGGNVVVETGAELRAARVSNVSTVSVNGTLRLSSASAVSDTIGGLAAGAGTLDLAANNSLTTGALTISPGNTFVKSGAGTLTALAQSFGNGSTLQVDAGTVLLNGLAAAFAGTGPDTNSGGGVVVNSGGTVRVNGSISGAAVVNGGGTLGGSGTVGATTINANGILAPGNSPGTLTTGTLLLDSNAKIVFELALAGTPGGASNDLLSVQGNLTLDGTLSVTALPGFGAGTYRIFDYTGTLTDNGLNLDNAFLLAFPGSTITTAVPGQVNLVVLVPEPTSLAALSGGVGLLLGLTRFRRRR